MHKGFIVINASISIYALFLGLLVGGGYYLYHNSFAKSVNQKHHEEPAKYSKKGNDNHNEWIPTHVLATHRKKSNKK
jgi:hypothetical protein